ncbi:MAG: ABC transporter permease [Bacteroidota bacterium]
MNKARPPAWAERFLRWYCNPFFLEEIEGDIYELFDRRARDQSVRRARLKFIWDVIRFFRWSNIKRSNSKNAIMPKSSLFRNYLKLGIRNLRKYPVTSAINILGLATALGMAITVYIFIDFQLHMNRFHTKGDRIHQVINYVQNESNNPLWSDTPFELGPRLLQDHPAVEQFTRVEYTSASVRYRDNVFEESMVFVDAAFMKMFDFAVLAGSPSALANKNQVIISYDMAKKYFGEEDPMAKEVIMSFGNGDTRTFEVGAVLEDYPYNSGMSFDFLLPMGNFIDQSPPNRNGWAYFTDATFVLLHDGHTIDELYSVYDAYVEEQQAVGPEWLVERFTTIPLYDLSTKGYEMSSPVVLAVEPGGRIALALIALFLLGMACFNFMNIAVVGAARRLREIALRKVMGGVRKEIIQQFMVENLLLCTIALLLGILISRYLLIPGFDVMVPELDFEFRTFFPFDLALFCIGLLCATAFLSGAYPALYISRFQPVTIFKGSQKLGSKNTFARVILGFQFFLAFQTIVAGVVFTDITYEMTKRDWGYEQHNTLSIYVQNSANYELMRNAVMDQPHLESFAGASAHVGTFLPREFFEYLDHEFALRRAGVTSGYLEMMGFQLVEGRFLTDQAMDRKSSVVVNEAFVRTMGWDESINQTFVMDSISRTVVGVVKNFHYDNFYARIEPFVFTGVEDKDICFMVVRSQDGLTSLDQHLRNTWFDIAPNEPYDRNYQEDTFNYYFRSTRADMVLMLIVTAMALFLACLGLYGLISMSIQGKLKEFGVRKVLGATPQGITRIAGKQYVWIVGIAFLLGAPLGAYLIIMMVDELYPVHKPITAGPFLLSISVILLTMIITVVGQVRRAVKVNPASILRSE